jgi:hypothetical protein
MPLARIFHAVRERGASLSGRGQWVCILRKFAGSNRSKVPMVPNGLNGLNPWKRFELNLQAGLLLVYCVQSCVE